MTGLCTAFYNKYTQDDAAYNSYASSAVRGWNRRNRALAGARNPRDHTHHYVEADLTMKDQALAHLQEPGANVSRYYAPNSLMEFLKGL